MPNVNECGGGRVAGWSCDSTSPSPALPAEGREKETEAAAAMVGYKRLSEKRYHVLIRAPNSSRNLGRFLMPVVLRRDRWRSFGNRSEVNTNRMRESATRSCVDAEDAAAGGRPTVHAVPAVG